MRRALRRSDALLGCGAATLVVAGWPRRVGASCESAPRLCVATVNLYNQGSQLEREPPRPSNVSRTLNKVLAELAGAPFVMGAQEAGCDEDRSLAEGAVEHLRQRGLSAVRFPSKMFGWAPHDAATVLYSSDCKRPVQERGGKGEDLMLACSPELLLLEPPRIFEDTYSLNAPGITRFATLARIGGAGFRGELIVVNFHLNGGKYEDGYIKAGLTDKRAKGNFVRDVIRHSESAFGRRPDIIMGDFNGPPAADVKGWKVLQSYFDSIPSRGGSKEAKVAAYLSSGQRGLRPELLASWRRGVEERFAVRDVADVGFDDFRECLLLPYRVLHEHGYALATASPCASTTPFGLSVDHIAYDPSSLSLLKGPPHIVKLFQTSETGKLLRDTDDFLSDHHAVIVEFVVR